MIQLSIRKQFPRSPIVKAIARFAKE